MSNDQLQPLPSREVLDQLVRRANSGDPVARRGQAERKRMNKILKRFRKFMEITFGDIVGNALLGRTQSSTRPREDSK